ncbi:TPA: hypothetical protein N0F65_011120, partial [Lagenidium giganteum]
VHIDTTYKTNLKGLPVICVGVSDAARTYHVVAVFLTSHENQKHFEKVFRGLKSAYENVSGTALRLCYVMAVAASTSNNTTTGSITHVCLRLVECGGYSCKIEVRLTSDTVSVIGAAILC